MEEEFTAILMGDAAVSAIVGQRVNFTTNPQGGAYPAIVLSLIGNGDGMTTTAPDGLDFGRIQVDCYDSTLMGAKTLGRAVRAALAGYRGGNFAGIFFDGYRSGIEGGSNEVSRPYRETLDFMTTWSE